MAVVSLKKGQKVELTKTNPGLTQIFAGMGWNPRRTDGEEFDLDASVFMLGEDGKCLPDGFIFYNFKEHPTGSVVHSGDNRTGAGEGDDEKIMINLSEVPANVSKIVFVVTIDQAQERRQNFGMVDNAYIRIVNAINDEMIYKFDLSEDSSVETAVIAAELYRHGEEWKFSAVGQGFAGGLAPLCRNYGINAE